jgi:hypothetical protein
MRIGQTGRPTHTITSVRSKTLDVSASRHTNTGQRFILNTANAVTTKEPTMNTTITRNRRHHSLLAGAIAAVAFATTALLTSSTALAPGPADLKAPLTGSTGATADAVFVNTGTPTRVLLWSSTFVPGGTYPAGTPCSTYGLSAGERTTKVIVVNASGTQRKCV